MLSSRPVQFPKDGISYPTRTPGRAPKVRAENAHAHAMTVNGKGKNVAPRTPFHPASAQPQRLFKDQKTVLTTLGRPLIDKTPMPNRIGTVLFKTPGVTKHNLKGEGNENPGSGQRPSSMRKHIKHPRISGKVLETPMNNGNHWDISDGDIVLEAQSLQQETINAPEDDLDEVEYGPPNTLDIPFQPYYDFELPDYKEVGKSLFQLAHSHLRDDAVPPLELNISSSDIEKMNWDMIPLPDIESDDPFILARLEAKLSPVNTPAVPSYLRSKRIPPPTSAVRQRPQSSLATAGFSRPATTKKNIPSNSTTPSLPSTSTLATKKTTVVRPPTSTTTLSVKMSSSTAVNKAGIRRAAAPASNVANPRVASGPSSLRRPHTSQAVTSSVKTPKPPQNKAAVDADTTYAVIIKDISATFDEDFEFNLNL